AQPTQAAKPAPPPWVEAKADAVKREAWPAPAAASAPESAAVAAASPAQVAKAEPAAPTRSIHVVRTGWIIQIGAYDTEDEAKQHLDAAQSKVKNLLRADAFTETVTKGDKTYYRARFAGLQRSQAEATCKQLRRNDMECMTVKN